MHRCDPWIRRGLLAGAFAAAACGSAPGTLHESGFFVPDEGRIISLSRTDPGRTTTIDAPADLDASRLLAPLVLIDVQERARTAPDFSFGADDLAEFEGRRGAIPNGALVVLRTGGGIVTRAAGGEDGARRHPGFSAAVVDVLCRQREAVGVGTDAPAIDASTNSEPLARDAALALGRFVVTDLARLDQIAGGSALAFVGAPIGASSRASVRVLALVPRFAAQGSR